MAGSAAAAAALAALGPGGLEAGEPAPRSAPPPKMPVGYVSHGSPMSALSETRGAEWKAWADAQPKPIAVLVVSAHFALSPVTIGATERVPLVYRHPRGAKAPTWAKEFDAWAKETLEKHDVDALLDWEKKAPAARTNHPTVEHFVPLLLAAGARRDGDVASFPLAGFDNVISSNRCVAFGPAPTKAG